jgi:hypothetical protein
MIFSSSVDTRCANAFTWLSDVRESAMRAASCWVDTVFVPSVMKAWSASWMRACVVAAGADADGCAVCAVAVTATRSRPAADSATRVTLGKRFMGPPFYRGSVQWTDRVIRCCCERPGRGPVRLDRRSAEAAVEVFPGPTDSRRASASQVQPRCGLCNGW